MSASAKLIGGVALASVGAALLLVPGGQGFGAVFLSSGIGMAAGGLAQTLTPTPQIGGGGSRGPDVHAGGTIPPELIVYGKALIPGWPVAVFRHREVVHNADDREFSHWMYVHTRRRRMNALVGVMINGEMYTLRQNFGHSMWFPDDCLIPDSGPYDKSIAIYFKPGGTDDANFDYAVSKSNGYWTSDHVLFNIAATYVVYRFRAELWPDGPPEIRFLWEGFLCYDPRTPNADPAYTDNAPLCHADAYCGPHAGLGRMEPTQIDAACLIEAANVADEDVDTLSGETVKRYRVGGFADATSPYDQVLTDLGSAYGAMVSPEGDTIKLYAAAARPVEMALTSEMLAGPVRVQPLRELDSLTNIVTTLFPDASNAYNDTQTPKFPRGRFVPRPLDDDGGDDDPGDGATNDWALGPDVTQQWVWITKSAAASIVQLSPPDVGVRIIVPDHSDTDLTASAVLISQAAVQGTFKHVFKWRWTHGGGSQRFDQLWFDLAGKGDAGYPGDVSLWDPANTESQVFLDHATGLYFSWATENAANPSLNNQIRLNYFNGDGSRTQILPAASFTPVLSEDYTFTVDRDAERSSLRIVVVRVSSGATVVDQSWTDTHIAARASAGGALMFRAEGRSMRLVDSAVTFPVVVVDPGGGDEDDDLYPEPPTLASLASGKRHNYTSFPASISAGAGEHYVLTGNQTGGTCTITGTGTLDQPIVIRGNVDSSNPEDWPEWSSGTLVCNNLKHFIVWRLRIRGRSTEGDDAIRVQGGSRWGRVARCRMYRMWGGQYGAFVQVVGDVQRFRVDRCHIAPRGSDTVQGCGLYVNAPDSGTAKPYKIDFFRNHVEGVTNDPAHMAPDGGSIGDDSEPVVTGASIGGTRSDLSVRVKYNLFLNNNNIEQVETKSGHTDISDNTIRVTAAAGQIIGPQLKLRHGELSTVARNLWRVFNTYNGTCSITVRDRDHTVIDNAALRENGTLANSQIYVFCGSVNADGWPANRVAPSQTRPNAKRAKIAGNRMSVLVGARGETDQAATFKADANIVAPASAARADRNAAVTIDTSLASNTDSATVVAGAQYGRALTELLEEDVGLAYPLGGGGDGGGGDGGGGGGGGGPGGWQLDGIFDLSQTWFDAYWIMMKANTGNDSSWAWTGSGISLKGGTRLASAANALTIANRVHVWGDFEVEFYTTRLSDRDPITGQAEIGFRFLWNWRGNKDATHPHYVSVWEYAQDMPRTEALKYSHAAGMVMYKRNAADLTDDKVVEAVRYSAAASSSNLTVDDTTTKIHYGLLDKLHWNYKLVGSTMRVTVKEPGKTAKVFNIDQTGVTAKGGFGFLAGAGLSVLVEGFKLLSGTIVSPGAILLYSGAQRWAGTTIKYAYPQVGYAGWGDTTAGDLAVALSSDWQPCNAQMVQAIDRMFGYLAAATGLTFTKVSDPALAQIKLAVSNTFNGANNGFNGYALIPPKGAVFFSPRALVENVNEGSYWFTVFIHEVQHAMNMRHPPAGSPMDNYALTAEVPNLTTVSPWISRPRPADVDAMRIRQDLEVVPPGEDVGTEPGGGGTVLVPYPHVEGRWYADDAPWNLPVADIATANPTDNAGFTNADLVDRFFAQQSTIYVNASIDDWSFPAYLATPSTPRVTLAVRDAAGSSLAAGGLVPWDHAGGWRPTSNAYWNGSGSTDAQAIIMDPATGKEINLWRINFDPATNVLTCTHAHAVVGTYTDGYAESTFARSIKRAYGAMLGRPEEIIAGGIKHALCVAVPNEHNATYFLPALGSDGIGSSFGTATGVPAGTRFQLMITAAQADAYVAALPAALPAAMKTTARSIIQTMMDYGWIISDNAGAAHWYFTERTSAGALWNSLGWASITVSGKPYPNRLFETLLTQANIRALVPSDKYPAQATMPSGGTVGPAPGGPDTVEPGGTTGPGGAINLYAMDDNQELPKEFRQPFVPYGEQCQRLQAIWLYRHRAQLTWQAPFLPHCVPLCENAMVVTYSDPLLRWSGKKFQIMYYKDATDGPVMMHFQEYFDAFYAWSKSDEQSISPVEGGVILLVDDTQDTEKNIAITFDPLANDQNAGDLTISSLSQPSHGTAEVDDNGRDVTYTPTTNYVGADAFTYTATDGINEGTATVSITVASNTGATAVDDSFNIPGDSPVTLDVLANDHPTAAAKTISAVTAPSHGTAVRINTNTAIRYTRAAGYRGYDSFSYTLSANAATDTARVTLSVGGGGGGGGVNSGLAWASGVTGSGDPQSAGTDLDAVCTWRGRLADIANFRFDRAGTMADMLDTIQHKDSYYALAQARGLRVEQVVPMIPGGESKGAYSSIFKACASGAYDSGHRAVARVINGYARTGRTVIRLAHECSSASQADSYLHDTSPGKIDWRNAYRRIADIYHTEIPGCMLQYDHIRTGPNPLQAYPGDDAVDIIGADCYGICLTASDLIVTDADWTRYADKKAGDGQPMGPRSWFQWAQEMGKQVAYAEWSVTSKPANADSPRYIQGMWDLFVEASAAGVLEYECLFNVPVSGANHQLYPVTIHPKASAKYKALWTP